MLMHALRIAVCLAVVLLGATTAAADDGIEILRLGTGGTGGTYFPIGSLLGQAVSEHRDGSGRLLDQGVPGLLVVSQISNGSVANVDAMRNGQLHAALVQSDVAYWAFHGTAIFGGKPRMKELRAVAHLYPESLHLVARKGSGIRSVKDLKGMRVSLDEPGSGTVLDARFILEYYGLRESDLKSVYLKPHFAVRAIETDQLDAFFIFAGYPVSAINRLAGSTGATLVPIEGPAVERILKAHPYFSRGVIPDGTYGQGIIPAGTYKGVADTPTLTVGAQLVVRADLRDELVYKITQALWSEDSLAMIGQGHPKGADLRLTQALLGISIPLHPGAARFYREQGMKIPDSGDSSGD